MKVLEDLSYFMNDVDRMCFLSMFFDISICMNLNTSVLQWKGVSRGLIGGFEGGPRGLTLRTPSEGPRKALGTPYQVRPNEGEKNGWNYGFDEVVTKIKKLKYQKNAGWVSKINKTQSKIKFPRQSRDTAFWLFTCYHFELNFDLWLLDSLPGLMNRTGNNCDHNITYVWKSGKSQE